MIVTKRVKINKDYKAYTMIDYDLFDFPEVPDNYTMLNAAIPSHGYNFYVFILTDRRIFATHDIASGDDLYVTGSYISK